MTKKQIESEIERLQELKSTVIKHHSGTGLQKYTDKTLESYYYTLEGAITALQTIYDRIHEKRSANKN